MQDIVQPKGNEEALVQQARQLGYGELIFAYAKPTEIKGFDLPVKLGILITEKTSRKDILFYKKSGYALILKATKTTMRSYIERGWVTHIIGSEQLWETDSLHYPKSGVNQVMAKLLKKHKVTALITLPLLNAKGKKGVQYYKRARLNAQLQKKFQFDMQCVSLASRPEDLRNPRDLQSILKVLAKPKI